MNDPFVIRDTPWHTWPKVGSVLLFVGITILLFAWPSRGFLERRVTWFVFFFGFLGVAIIWFPDIFEDYEHLTGESLLDKVKPANYEVSIGWLYLLGPFAFWLVMKLV